ncbi:MAG: acyl-CoA dehydrogenase family protein [Solirubrobacteraceae bacterium]
MTDPLPDFLLAPAERALRADVAGLLDRELSPVAGAIEDDDNWSAVTRVARALGHAGHLRAMFDDAHEQGGLTRQTIVSEEAALRSYAFETTIATSLSCAFALHRHATAPVRARHLPGLLDGSAAGAICVTEAQAGSDTGAMRTVIRRDARTGEWVIDGAKRYISNAGVADTYVVYGLTGSDASAHGITAVVVPKQAGGLSFPRRYRFMGRHGCVVGELALDGCRVPAENVLAGEGQGHEVMRSMFNVERILVGGAALGVARSAFDLACAHARRRYVFGRPLGARQLTWARIADCSCRIDSAALLTYRAAKLYDAGAGGKTLAGPAAMAKLTASETALFCADAAVQICGADGLTKQYGRVEQIYRDARALPIVGGTSEIARYLIAHAALPGLELDL